jgi:hypothetical protein
MKNDLVCFLNYSMMNCQQHGLFWALKSQYNYNLYTRSHFLPWSFNILNRLQVLPNHFNTDVLVVCDLKILCNIRHKAVWGTAEHGSAALVYITNNTADYASTRVNVSRVNPNILPCKCNSISSDTTNVIRGKWRSCLKLKCLVKYYVNEIAVAVR